MQQKTNPNPDNRNAEEELHAIRAIDAAANRAREGLRTAEDYLRFVLDDRHLTQQCKQLRHLLTEALQPVGLSKRMAARETQADVGTTLSTKSEEKRHQAADVLTANFTRLQEALRSLEEFGKLVNPAVAAKIKQLRYRAYTLQRAAEITNEAVSRLANARLYVLIDGETSPQRFTRRVELLIGAGVHVIQLRDKRLDDRELLGRARLLREATASTDTLFIINDRPDLAALSRADGVHIGQEEVTVKDARTIVGTQALVGVSTHSIDQARQAVLDGANYIGLGPTFPSDTKHFADFPGLELLETVSAEIRLPSFAIGGITLDNLPQVLATGINRIATSAAITSSTDPATTTRKFLAALE